MLSNKDMYNLTMDVVKRLREFGTKYEVISQRDFNESIVSQRAAKSDDERRKVWEEEARKSQMRNYQMDLEFRNTIWSDAEYVRNELLKRNLKEPQPNPLTPPEIIKSVFAGRLFGAFPEFAATDYLEQLVKQLPMK